MVIDRYVEEFELEPFTFLRKAIYKGTCRSCKEKDLLVFPKLNNVWSFCPHCNFGCSLEKLTNRKTYVSFKEKLWIHYLKSVKLFNLSNPPFSILNQLGLSGDYHDPFRQAFANKVIAYTPSFAKFTEGIRNYNINVSCRGLSKFNRSQPALLLPRCSSPGMIFGYEVVHPDGIYTMKFPQYTPTDKVYIYLQINVGSKTIYFHSIEEAFSELRGIVLGDARDYSFIVKTTSH